MLQKAPATPAATSKNDSCRAGLNLYLFLKTPDPEKLRRAIQNR